MRVSVLVVSYNARDHLAACLRSLAAAAGAVELEVIVADNASADDSVAVARAELPAADVVEMRDNLGFSAAINAAARRADGELLLLLNPDTVLPPGSIEAMATRLAASPRAAALGVRQVDGAGFFQLAVGPGPSVLSDLGRRVLQRGLDRGSHRIASLVDSWLSRPRRVPWVAGSCLLVRHADFEAVGGFDEGFFLYFEDIDFCLRLGAAGREVLYDPTITIVHHRGVSAATARGLAARAYRDSQARFWRKHRGGLVGLAITAYAAARRPREPR